MIDHLHTPGCCDVAAEHHTPVIVHGLFFTLTGGGPDAVAVYLDEVPCPRPDLGDRPGIGIMVKANGEIPLRFNVVDGGTLLSIEAATAFRDGLTALLNRPRDAARAAAEVVADSGWVDKSTIGDDLLYHRRTVGEFVMRVVNESNGWAWSVEWGDNTIEDGDTANTRADNDSPDAWASSLPRAKAACEAAARKAGIAVAK